MPILSFLYFTHLIFSTAFSFAKSFIYTLLSNTMKVVRQRNEGQGQRNDWFQAAL